MQKQFNGSLNELPRAKPPCRNGKKNPTGMTQTSEPGASSPSLHSKPRNLRPMAEDHFLRNSNQGKKQRAVNRLHLQTNAWWDQHVQKGKLPTQHQSASDEHQHRTPVPAPSSVHPASRTSPPGVLFQRILYGLDGAPIQNTISRITKFKFPEYKFQDQERHLSVPARKLPG